MSVNSWSSAMAVQPYLCAEFEEKQIAPSLVQQKENLLELSVFAHQDEDRGDCQLEQNLPFGKGSKGKLEGPDMMRLLCGQAFWKCWYWMEHRPICSEYTGL